MNKKSFRLRCLVSLAIALGASVSGCKKKQPDVKEVAVTSSASALLLDAPPRGRCAMPVDAATVVIGDVAPDGDADGSPFAAEVGAALAYDQGWAVGLLKPDAKGPQAAVLTLDRDGKNPTTIALGSALGDTPPPKLASRSATLVAALLEAGPSTRRLRLASIQGATVHWGPSFEQGPDESFAFDIALGETRGVAAWDDGDIAPERGVIRLTTFAYQPDALRAASPVHAVTGKQTDADTPRVVVRPGGFWLLWAARRADLRSARNEDHEATEEPSFRWLEALALDAQGAPVGAPRRLTPAEGHVLFYDVQPAEGGEAIVVYSDGDGPSGAAANALRRVVLRETSVSEPQPLGNAIGGLSSVNLLPGWVAVVDVASETRLAPIGPLGDLLAPMDREPVLGTGEPLAATIDRVLVARPGGKGVRLFVTTCSR